MREPRETEIDSKRRNIVGFGNMLYFAYCNKCALFYFGMFYRGLLVHAFGLSRNNILQNSQNR